MDESCTVDRVDGAAHAREPVDVLSISKRLQKDSRWLTVRHSPGAGAPRFSPLALSCGACLGTRPNTLPLLRSAGSRLTSSLDGSFNVSEHGSFLVNLTKLVIR